MKPRPPWLRGLLAVDDAFAKVEAVVLVVSVALMVVLFFFYVLFRNISAELSAKWLSELPLQMVLWVSLFGTSLAAKKGRHIAIDIAPRLLSGLPLRFVRALTLLFAAVMAGVLCYASVRYLQTVELAEDTIVQNIAITIAGSTLLEIPSWFFVALAPAGFGLASWHFLVAMIRVLHGDTPHDAEEVDESLEAPAITAGTPVVQGDDAGEGVTP